MAKPEWITPEHQKLLIDIYNASKGYCVATGRPCKGSYESSAKTYCKWGVGSVGKEAGVCLNPLQEGELCPRGKQQDPSFPLYPCQTVTVGVSRWKCAYGDYPCFSAVILPNPFGITLTKEGPKETIIGELMYSKPEYFEDALKIRRDEIASLTPMERRSLENTIRTLQAKDYTTILFREWSQLHQQLKAAQWEHERKAMHDLGERKGGRLRGRFTVIGAEIYHADQNEYIIQGIEPMIDPDTLKTIPVARVRLANSTDVILVDISEAKKAYGKNAWNKLMRYGKPLGGPDQFEVEKIVSKEVMQFRQRPIER
ncbi:MAG: hypothetical protein EHM36_11425 [Deltaproteobacteria bacterium]|nr:MAG: hypothetical protein EHM36_11425 [Deltaproteobacteria bacterium]